MPRALLIEDDPTTAELTSDLIGELGLSVTVAATAAEAREAVQANRFDLVVLDLILPDADGLMLLVDLRRRIDTPIVVCTATNRHRDSVLSLRLGADDFVAKPFDILELEERIRAVLRRTARPAAHRLAHTA